MNSLSTHVLDTTHGCPATGVALRLITEDGTLLHVDTTNADGRCPALPSVLAAWRKSQVGGMT